MSDRQASGTRQRLLEAGLQLLHEQGVTPGVGHIRLQDVVRRAGLTTGAAYRQWADQGAFHHDLALAAARHRDGLPLTRVLRAIRDLIDDGAPLRDVVRAAAGAWVEALSELCEASPTMDTSFVTALAVRVSAHDDELRAEGRARHRETVGAFAAVYRMCLATYDLRLRPPLTVDHFASAAAALAEGFAVQAVQREPHLAVTIVHDGREEHWTTFGLAVLGLVEVMTEPAGPNR